MSSNTQSRVVRRPMKVRAHTAMPSVVSVVLSDGTTRALDPVQAEAVEIALADEEMLSPTEAARLLSVSRPMVVKWIGDGLLPDNPVGAHHRIPRDAVLALKETRRAASLAAMERLAAADEGDAEAMRMVALAKVASYQMVADRQK